MHNEFWKIKSFNFTAWNAAKFKIKEAKRQIDAMIEKCAVNTVTIAVSAYQAHIDSTDIDWQGPRMLKDEQITELIHYSRAKGLKVIMKPMLNTRDGYWRAYIRFFDEDVPCEPKWGDWFQNYMAYMVHFAELCQKESVEMLIIGCEMVGTDHREREWRELIKAVRRVYAGLITYNCDKYQEHNVKWWDALDLISSSGYYPEDDWDRQLERIETVVRKFDKPFFFAEVGCPSTKDAAKVPNNWKVIGQRPVDLEEQHKFFKIMFEKCQGLKWHYGYSIWSWPVRFRTFYAPKRNGGYAVVGKPAEEIIRKYYSVHICPAIVE